MSGTIDLEALCHEKGLRITEQRRIIARVISDSEDHPDVETLYERASKIDSGISIATVYRTVRLFEEAGILDRHDFGDGRSRYEAAPEAHRVHAGCSRVSNSTSLSATAARQPGSTSVVVSVCSMIAGPLMTWPGARPSRS